MPRFLAWPGPAPRPIPGSEVHLALEVWMTPDPPVHQLISEDEFEIDGREYV